MRVRVCVSGMWHVACVVCVMWQVPSVMCACRVRVSRAHVSASMASVLTGNMTGDNM
jgi:hypothetical protein